MALAAEQAPDGPTVVAVVCDGVSSSARPDEASQVAAQAGLPILVAAVQVGGDLGEGASLRYTAIFNHEKFVGEGCGFDGVVGDDHARSGVAAEFFAQEAA